MEIYNSIVQFFQQGGVFMYPIMVVLALGLAIALERYIYLSYAGARNRSTWDRVMPLIQAGKYDEARAYAENSRTAISKVLSYGLRRLGISRKRDDIEMAMEEGLMEVVPRVEKRTHYLATLANIATLLGLLGTIIGLIEAFTAVASANPAERADMLSASISVAMNTTAFGLMVGIPLLLIHAVLQTKSTQLVDSLEMASVKVLNLINGAQPQPQTQEALA
ncbi:flagellar motor protein MotA [Alkalilimnicola ehrlichii]|uniref:Flagellar motor protein MotA n=1 Tax=Alkalilimnicola ehrlichii TaxID=351052 RepID=A0A3E0X0C9_9GAMM|nr:MotA/TolQ/ExbB proton channel family protein [Alkalilimnicola ehrlichii]RFA30934.1 flagellar motor protein MotA [Alkalilimnicola ehrlichii]RFA38884.1 flagellar motor protein MotA [Alkalilimnicola ehrlichii]